MQFDLTRSQILNLARIDPTFLEKVVDVALGSFHKGPRNTNLDEAGTIENQAKKFAASCGGSKLAAIRALQNWSKQPENLATILNSGYELSHGRTGSGLAVIAAKKLIEGFI